jgi:general secretion pathway protein K
MALMLVMVVIFALTVIVAAFAYSMSVEMRLAQISDYDIELEWMGRSGIELARYALANKCPDQKDIDALNQFWAGGTAPCTNDIAQFSLKDFAIGHGRISVTITDMERKFDINQVANSRAPQMEILQKALTEAGVTDPTQSSTIAESILDWINPGPDARINGAKDEYYSRQNPPYYCKGGPIEDINELLLIRGITPEIFWGSNSTNHPPAAYQQQGFNHTPRSRKSRFANEANNVPNPVGLVEIFSPFGGKLNINTASAQALQILPGIDANTAQRIIQERAGPDGTDGTEDDVPFHNLSEVMALMPGGVPPGTPGGGPAPVPQPGQPGGVQPGGTNAPGALNAPGGLGAYCDVRSYVFEVRVEAEVNGVKRSFVGLVGRSASNASQIQCTRFHWED